MAIILIVIMVWIWYMHMAKPDCDIIHLNDFLNPNITFYNKYKKNLKTGDLILFKSLNNLNSVLMCNYYTHIGIVLVDPVLTNNKPIIVEASGTNAMKWLRRNIALHTSEMGKSNSCGIWLSPLEDRVKRYLGYVYYKPLSHPITKEMHIKLINFVFYAMNNMFYDYNILGGCIKKKFMNGRCDNGTNCGEFVFLCLINMGLLDIKNWYRPCFHYLRWMCRLKNLTNGYSYNKIFEINKTTLNL